MNIASTAVGLGLAAGIGIGVMRGVDASRDIGTSVINNDGSSQDRFRQHVMELAGGAVLGMAALAATKMSNSGLVKIAAGTVGMAAAGAVTGGLLTTAVGFVMNPAM